MLSVTAASLVPRPPHPTAGEVIVGKRCEGLGMNPFTGLQATNTLPGVGRGSLLAFALYGVPIRMNEMSLTRVK